MGTRPGRGCLLDDGDDSGLHKHAPAHLAVKVAHALDGAVILAGAILQLQTDPFTGREVGGTDELDNGESAIGIDLDGLPDLESRHGGQIRCSW